MAGKTTGPVSGVPAPSDPNPAGQGTQPAGSQPNLIAVPDPIADGWYMLRFQNGDIGLMQHIRESADANSGVWKVGNLTLPNSGVIQVHFLGANLTDVAKNSASWAAALHNLGVTSGTAQITTLIGEIDHGATGIKGQPIVVDPTGKLIDRSSQKTYSEAAPASTGVGNAINGAVNGAINGAKSLVPSGPDLSGVAIRVLEAVGAILLLAIGLRALISGDNPTSITMSAVRKVAR